MGRGSVVEIGVQYVVFIVLNTFLININMDFEDKSYTFNSIHCNFVTLRNTLHENLILKKMKNC